MKKASIIRSVSALFGMMAVLLLILWGCKSAQEKQAGNNNLEIDPEDKDELIEELSGYPLPTAYDITQLAYRAGAPYQMNLSNEPGKAEEYITQRDKALNLGVYGADLCYASTHGMKHPTMLYLEASEILVDELGISTTFNLTYAERIEANLDDRDSVINIVSDSFVDTWNYLIENKQDLLARLVVCGSWIEGIYITTNIATMPSLRDNAEYLEILANQKNSLNKLVTLMEPVKDLNEVNEVFKGLWDLQDIYDDVEEQLTEEQLHKITARIEALRGSIV